MFGGMRPSIARYGTGLLSVLIAFLFTWLLPQIADASVGSLFLVAVTITAWFGGLGPGLLATALSSLAIIILMMMNNQDPKEDIGLETLLRTGSFLLVALLSGSLNAARKRAEEALRERDVRLQLVSEQLPAALWSTDDQLQLTSAFGARLDGDLSGEHSFFQEINSADPNAAAVVAHRAALRGNPSTYESGWRGRTFESHVEPLRNLAGQIIGVVGVALDITQRKESEDALKIAKDMAESADRAKDQFLAALSHELRTPLTPVLLSVEAMETDEQVPAWIRQELSMVRRNVELEATLIDDLLDLTRIAKGKLPVRLETVDAHALLRQALQIARPDAEFKRLAITLDSAAHRHFVRADSARLQQVFWNVIKNAVKFTPDGGRVSIRTFDGPGGHLHVEVADTGIGVEPEHLSRIFNAFDQGDPAVARQFGGLGLGLAISRALMELHNGALLASSEGRGRGSTFTITLPGVDAPAEPHIDDPSISGARRPAGGLRILLVEDHEATATVMARLLRRSGHQVITVATCAAALEASASSPFDLIISDLGLPDGSGHDLMAQLRGRGDVRGIALSGYGMEEDLTRSRAAGFACHLTKPIQLEKLEDAIHTVMTGSQPVH